MEWRLIRYQVGDPAWNMAVDEALFLNYREGASPPVLRFYGWSPPTLSVGYFQDIEREVERESVAQKGYGLVRRITGGRAVLHDRELTYSVIGGVSDGLPDGLRDSYQYIARALLGALQKLGITANMHGSDAPRQTRTGACFEAPSWYELTVGGRKLVGSAQFRKEGSFLQHGSILIRFSPMELIALLRTAALDRNLGMELAAKVTSLFDLGQTVEPEELADLVAASFQQLYGINWRIGALSDHERELARCLVRRKYANPEWNDRRGRSADRETENLGGRA